MKNDSVFTDRRLLQTIDLIDPKFIAEVFDDLKVPKNYQAEYTKPSPFKHWKQYLAAAACILLLSFLIPTFSYVSEVIGSIVAGTGASTTEMTEDFESREETLNSIETTEEQTVQEPTPDFPYSNVKIIADNNASINPVSVHIGYTWYKDEKSAFTEEIAGWQYVMNIESYKYENFPHLTLERRLTSSLPENVTISSFMVYSTNWEETEYFFDNLYELSNLPAGDYIIVGIEKEKIPYDKPHYVIGEYDYKLDKSAIIFGLTVTDSIVAVNDLEYWKFIPELEEIDYDTMLEVKRAWAEFIRANSYFYYYEEFLQTGYALQVVEALAQQSADSAAENAYQKLFNSSSALHYAYLGRTEDAVVIATFTEKQREPISMEIVYDLIIEIYVYNDGNIISLEDAYKMKIISYDDMIKFETRSEKYESLRFWYATRESEQTDR